jgi:hypothetical protein
LKAHTALAGLHLRVPQFDSWLPTEDAVDDVGDVR